MDPIASVLIVDDNTVNRMLARRVLETGGFCVDEAGDADQALDRLQAAVPDIILMDIGLPGMDGLTLTRLLKADPRWKAIPVVAWTAFDIESGDLRALAAGCLGYLTKPIDTRQFAQRIRSYLESARTDSLST